MRDGLVSKGRLKPAAVTWLGKLLNHHSANNEVGAGRANGRAMELCR